VWEAIELANRHPRVNILKPGPGVGGHCIAVDPWFIVQATPELTPLIQAARRVNDGMPAYVGEMVNSAVEGIENPVIACLGLAYKADVDDTRDSPAIKVVELLRVKGFEVRAYDPHVKMGVVPGQVESIDSAVESADCVVFLTDHDEFRQLSLDKISSLNGSGGPWSIVDTRNVLAVQGGQRTANRRLLGRGKAAD
jgi:UDP-N-acetyl-D-mannosaminuronic acid dehydrogenase